MAVGVKVTKQTADDDIILSLTFPREMFYLVPLITLARIENLFKGNDREKIVGLKYLCDILLESYLNDMAREL